MRTHDTRGTTESLSALPTLRTSEGKYNRSSENCKVDSGNYFQVWVKPCRGKEAQMKEKKWPLYTGGIGAAASFFYASEYVCLSRTASRIFSHFLSPTNHSAHPRLRLLSYTGL